MRSHPKAQENHLGFLLKNHHPSIKASKKNKDKDQGKLNKENNVNLSTVVQKSIWQSLII